MNTTLYKAITKCEKEKIINKKYILIKIVWNIQKDENILYNYILMWNHAALSNKIIGVTHKSPLRARENK